MDPVAVVLLTLLVWCVYVILSVGDLRIKEVETDEEEEA